MKKQKDDCFIVGIGHGDASYTIGSVRYLVSSHFASTNLSGEGEETLSEKLGRFIGSDFADLTVSPHRTTLSDEYACSAAGEEDN